MTSAHTFRFIWWAALALVALFAVLAQLDRSSRFHPQLASLVPQALSGFAAEQRTRAAIAAEQGSIAVAEARGLIAHRPLPAEHLTLLSLAATLEDDRGLALAAMEASTTRGWREPIAQFASARAALDSGQVDIAAQRITALLSTGALPEQASTLLAELIATPEGRSAMAIRYAATGRWQANSLTSALPAADPADAALLVREALEAGAGLPCDRLAILAAAYQSEDLQDDRALFWPGDCPSD